MGLIESGGRDHVRTAYGDEISYGIRRCEFDHYLLQRSGARVMAGTPVTSIKRVTASGNGGSHWIVNETIRTPLLIGAGGHFCPVARWINGPMSAASVVVAQEAEFPIVERSRLVRR